MNSKNLKILFFKKETDKNETIPSNNENIITSILKENPIDPKIEEHLNNTLLINNLVKINLPQIITPENNSKNKLEDILNESVEIVDNILYVDDVYNKSTVEVEDKVVDNKVNEEVVKNLEIINSLLKKIDEKFDFEKNQKFEELEKIKNDFIIKNDAEKNSLKNYIQLKLKNTKIPLIIYQTWITKLLPEKMMKSVEKIKNANPEFEYKFFDDTDCRNFIINHFNDNVLYAYDNLIPGAFKADLWRYCILYIHGGIYIDIKYEPINDFKFMELIDKDYFVLDRPAYFKGLIGIYNAFMISQPNNPIFLKLIKAIIDNVKNKIYGINALSVTGPSLLGKLLYPDNNKYTPSLSKEYDLKYSNDGLTIEYKGKKILLQYPEYRKDQVKYTKISYQNLWDKKKIFKN